MSLTLEEEDVLSFRSTLSVALFLSALEQPKRVGFHSHGHGELVKVQVKVKVLVPALVVSVDVAAFKDTVVEVDGRGVGLMVVHSLDGSHGLFHTPKDTISNP